MQRKTKKIKVQRKKKELKTLASEDAGVANVKRERKEAEYLRTLTKDMITTKLLPLNKLQRETFKLG